MNFVYYEQATPEMIEKYRMYEETEMRQNGGYLYGIRVFGCFNKFFSFGGSGRVKDTFQDIFLDNEAECYLRVGSIPGYIGGKHAHSFLLYFDGRKILFTIHQENDAGEYDKENIKLVWIWDKGEKNIHEMASVLPFIKEAICSYFTYRWQKKEINLTFDF
ncbi:hypothetical protein [Conchiformibius kuhniae]|uniref:Uncharacterized protein n=1 Tax=Conchiformibius kuhniae TaxID=211502 RepID=A0A8T9MU62_9NEIS|nr:hypothetical protein [Conchiformibius kuhniae]